MTEPRRAGDVSLDGAEIRVDRARAAPDLTSKLGQAGMAVSMRRLQLAQEVMEQDKPFISGVPLRADQIVFSCN